MEFKLTINDPKTGKSYKREAKDSAADLLNRKRIGDKVKGETIDMNGYEFEITGGTDTCGFPMRKDVESPRKKILAVSGVGLKSIGKGIRQRKTVCGNQVREQISLVNLKIVKYGKSKLDEETSAPETQKESQKDPPKEETKPDNPKEADTKE